MRPVILTLADAMTEFHKTSADTKGFIKRAREIIEQAFNAGYEEALKPKQPAVGRETEPTEPSAENPRLDVPAKAKGAQKAKTPSKSQTPEPPVVQTPEDIAKLAESL